MKSKSQWVISALLTGLLAAAGGVSGAFASEENSKLKELERAMSAPAEGGKKQYRTRAIVFDNEAQPAAAAPAVAGGQPAAVAASAGNDCSAVSPDAKSVPVDFAIQFKLGSAEISPTSEPTLREIAKILSLNPERCVVVEGHTDAIGSAESNMVLSRERAASVVRFITEKSGIERGRLIPIGKGFSDPLRNLDPRDKKNRRVVFKVVG